MKTKGLIMVIIGGLPLAFVALYIFVFKALLGLAVLCVIYGFGEPNEQTLLNRLCDKLFSDGNFDHFITSIKVYFSNNSELAMFFLASCLVLLACGIYFIDKSKVKK